MTARHDDGDEEAADRTKEPLMKFSTAGIFSPSPLEWECTSQGVESNTEYNGEAAVHSSSWIAEAGSEADRDIDEEAKAGGANLSFLFFFAVAHC